MTLNTFLLAIVFTAFISGCAGTGSPGSKDKRLEDSREKPIELSSAPLPETQLVQVANPGDEKLESQFLSERQRTVFSRTPKIAMAELNAMRSQLDQSLDLCEGLPVHKEAVPIARVKLPPYRTYYSDPAFRTRVMRITNGGFGDVHKPMYSTVQAWNADESLMILYHGGNSNEGHHLYDGKTYKRIRSLPIQPVDLEQVFWSHTEPDYFYYVSEGASHYNKLVKFNARTRKATPVVNLAPMCGKDIVPTSGNDIQMPSYDDNLFSFRCSEDEESLMRMFTYNVDTGEIKSRKIGSGSDFGAWDAPAPAPSGKRFRLENTVLSADLEPAERRLNMGDVFTHASIGQLASGEDAFFSVAFAEAADNCTNDVDKGIGHLIAHSLESGECRSIISQGNGYPYPASSTHISALSHLRPGWVAVSSVGTPEKFPTLQPNETLEPLVSEIYLANTDPNNQKVCRLAQHRSYARSAKKGGYHPYFGEPHVTLSPSGTRMLFGSDWYDSGTVNTYVIELPAYKP